MYDAKKSNKSKKSLVCAIVSVVSLLVIATTVATIKYSSPKNNGTDESYTIDLQAYDDEETDPNHECKHASLLGEEVQEMIDVLEKGETVTTIFHQDSDVAHSFNKDGLELTDDRLCFNTFDDNKFCFDLAASGLSSADIVVRSNDGVAHRRIEEGNEDEAPFTFNFTFVFFVLFTCNSCPNNNLLAIDGFRF